MLKRIGITFINSLLLVSIISLLVAHLVLVNDLPSQIYTPTQQEYLRYNYSRNVSQLAPTWNIIQADGQIGPPILPVQESHVQATLDARFEEQEGVSVTLYDLDFRGEYRLAHPGPMAATVELFFPFPGNLETLHGVRFLVDGEEPPGTDYSTRGISWQTVLQAGEEHQIEISYQADGASSFAYGLHHDQRTDIDITLTVLGLTGSEIPRHSLPPTTSKVEDGGETFTWSYTGLIADRDIQLTLPTRLSFAQRIARLQDDFRALARLAPFLVGLFLAALAGVLHLSGMHLRLESYLLIGLGLAFFYPLLTFLSGMVGVLLASILALSLVSGLLLVFLGLTLGWSDTRWRVGLLLVIFLGFFSLGMLTPWRGLLLSGGGLSLVGTFMLLYARRPALPEPEPDSESVEVAPEPEPESAEAVSEPEPAPLPEEVTPASANLFCPYCAHTLADDYSFCPGCGHDTHRLHRCADCGYTQFVPEEHEPVYCVRCGQLLG